MENLKFTLLEADVFDQFASHHPLSNLWQNSMMAAMQQAKGSSVYYPALLNEKNEVVAASMMYAIPAFMGSKVLSAPRGPLMDFDDAQLVNAYFTALKAWMKKEDVLYLQMSPYVTYLEHDLEGNVIADAPNGKKAHQNLMDFGFRHEGFSVGIDLSREPRWIYTVNFNDMSPEQLLASFERKTARSVKNALKYNVQVRELNQDELHITDEILAMTGEERGFEWRNEDYHQNVYRFFHEKEGVKFLEAFIDLDEYHKTLQKDLEKAQKQEAECQANLEKMESKKMRNKYNEAQRSVESLQVKMIENQKLIEKEGSRLSLASGVFFTCGKEVLCLMSGVKKQFTHFCAPYAMHWKMMNYAMSRGMERYNLYGMSGYFTPDAEDYGVYLFKKGFSGQIYELLGDYILPGDSAKYKLYSSLRAVKHLIKK